MNIDTLLKLLDDNKANLTHILNNCNDGPSELVLLASKMTPILEEFSSLEAELLNLCSAQQDQSVTSDQPDIQT